MTQFAVKLVKLCYIVWQFFLILEAILYKYKFRKQEMDNIDGH